MPAPSASTGATSRASSPQARCRAGIGRSFQIPQPFANLTVFENLLVGGDRRAQRRASATPRQTAWRVLERAGLLPLANRRAGSLTLLERKRLEMARALATGPRLLLARRDRRRADRSRMRRARRHHQGHPRDGITIIWIEHIVHALLAVVDRLMVLEFRPEDRRGEPRARDGLRAEVREIYMGIEV